MSIASTMEQMREVAKAKATGDETGHCCLHGIVCAYYPRSKRFAWFDEHQIINKGKAEQRLTKAMEKATMNKNHKPRWRAVYDTDPDVPDDGMTFMHCRECMGAVPVGESPKTWARQQIAIRNDGRFQVRCTRHDINIAVITIEENTP